MAQEVTNFARFYALFNKLPCTGDREEFKKDRKSTRQNSSHSRRSRMPSSA